MNRETMTKVFSTTLSLALAVAHLLASGLAVVAFRERE